MTSDTTSSGAASGSACRSALSCLRLDSRLASNSATYDGSTRTRTLGFAGVKCQGQCANLLRMSRWILVCSHAHAHKARCRGSLTPFSNMLHTSPFWSPEVRRSFQHSANPSGWTEYSSAVWSHTVSRYEKVEMNVVIRETIAGSPCDRLVNTTGSPGTFLSFRIRCDRRPGVILASACGTVVCRNKQRLVHLAGSWELRWRGAPFRVNSEMKGWSG